jgi:putative glutamine amidotransferase
MSRRSLASRAGRPLIGVTTSEVRRSQLVSQTKHGEPPQHEMALGIVYLKAVELAGGIPLVIPPLDEETIEPLLDRLDGLCLSGGPDIHPSVYGEEENPQLGPTEPDLDLFELAICRRADAREMPILAICRGMQNLNVSRGGTLIQHLGDIEGRLQHRQTIPGDEASHSVAVEPGSLLARCLGQDSVEVNSFHHQAVDRLGDHLKIIGRAPDTTVEAVEASDREFCLGVQWHAELLVGRYPEQLRMFESFVEASADQVRSEGARDVA